MVEKVADKEIVEIRKLLKGKDIIIGSEKTLKNLKLGKISKVYLSSNCSEKVRDSIKHYSKLSKTSVVNLRCLNDELGILCKKPFSISVLGVK